MKLKLIKDNEVVVSREEYEELLNRPRKYCEEDCGKFINSITKGVAKFEYETFGKSCLVAIFGERCAYPIKKFNSDDPDYNRVCAEELVELLNQEQ